ncbi:uncharacterized protein LOC113294991 [Papaver somniferum]|uniref:uncharacterized protein LOC113294991 n=1 Tax=Papaver somniferum TaxID=3469 RepID=UPI000E703DC3|nr:uncharacterized protein LOC113294991 [Papaver somniferum]
MPRGARLTDIRRHARLSTPYHLTAGQQGHDERHDSALIAPCIRLSNIRRQARQASRLKNTSPAIPRDDLQQNSTIPTTAIVTHTRTRQASHPTNTSPAIPINGGQQNSTIPTTQIVTRRWTRSNHNRARNYVNTRRMTVHMLPQPTICDKCGAMLFSSETKEMCCKNGKVSSPPLRTPVELRMLYNDQSDVGKHFRQNIKIYNHMFAFTSMGVHYDAGLANGCDRIYTFRDQGGIYYRIGSLLPTGPMPRPMPRYLQWYIYDSDREIELRMLENTEMQVTMVERLKLILDQHNPFVHQFRRLAMRRDIPKCKLVLREQPLGGHQFNLPTSDQVAAIIVGGEDLTNVKPRETIVETTEGNLQMIPDTIGYFDPLQYPLLLPYGNYRWDLNNISSGGQRVRVSCRTFYSYMLQV